MEEKNQKNSKDMVKFDDSEEENCGLNRLKYEVDEAFIQFKFQMPKSVGMMGTIKSEWKINW